MPQLHKHFNVSGNFRPTHFDIKIYKRAYKDNKILYNWFCTCIFIVSRIWTPVYSWTWTSSFNRFFSFISGAAATVYSLIQLIYNKHDKFNLGSLIMNIVVISGVAIYLTIEINKDTGTETITNKADIITIYKDSNTNSASVVNGLGDTLILKVGDSIIIDKTKAPQKP